MISKKYFTLLEKEMQKEGDPKSIPPEGESPEDGLVVQKPNLIHYAPNKALDSIKQNGLFSEEVLAAHDPKMKNVLAKRYAPFIQSRLGVPAEKVKPDNVLHFLNMHHPGHTRSIYAFFTRIPEGIDEYHSYLQKHTPIRISLSKLQSSNVKHTLYGVNFPNVNRWLRLGSPHITKLCDKNKDWYQFFAAIDPQGFFNKVPHAAIHTPKGIIPPFAIKILDESFDKN